MEDKMPESLISAAIERLEAEKMARIQAKIDAGKAVRWVGPADCSWCA